MGGPAQTQTSTNTNATPRHQKQQEDDLCGDSPEGTTASTRATTSSLPPSIDLALLTTAHSLLQLNRAAAAAAAAASTSTTSSITSSSPSTLASTLLSAPASSTSSIAGVYKGVKRFDENTPPIPTLLPHSAYSHLANLPKIFFPASSAQHHPGHGFLRPTTPAGSFLTSPQQHITFPFTASSTTPSISTPTSDTSKLQRLVEKLEKEPQEKKIYHCSECGKEYASRSGLKGHMKHHGGVAKAPRAPAKTKGPERVLHHERSQTHHLATFLPPGHQ
ncbi:hypothetical protein cypCar_00008331 [Cyprinus carpio]|nr:hypothetical protein cypCar_00008331 [Cyprinus carpio]